MMECWSNAFIPLQYSIFGTWWGACPEQSRRIDFSRLEPGDRRICRNWISSRYGAKYAKETSFNRREQRRRSFLIHLCYLRYLL
jgi:hypothetical protein